MNKNRRTQKKTVVVPNPLTLPFEFVVLGTPASVQGSAESRKIWKAEVSTNAKASKPPQTHPIAWGNEVKVKIWYYFIGEPPGSDIDNIIKPILDACNRIVYQDDRFVKEVCSHRVSIETIEKSKITNSELQKGFVYNSDFVHVLFEEVQ